ncbi:MAG: glycoside hydrolase family 97 catalytic domain-containing protein, partial [Melioribacteraceae bacterium]|nr:glycoside hydrolase family 97 catalytic domain-containing protein [Melioribacteraceae bacterium]
MNRENRKSLLHLIIGILFIISFPACSPSQTNIESPNSILQLQFKIDNGEAFYSLSRKGIPVIEKSLLGFELKEHEKFWKDWEIESTDRSSFDETWEQPWGEVQFIANTYTEMVVNLQGIAEPTKKLSIVFRLYDDGLGFRYEFPESGYLNDFVIMDELTQFNLKANHKAWYIKAYQDNRYEYLYESSPVNNMGIAHTPVTMETADGLYISFHEAELVNFASMTIEATGSNGLKANLVPWSDGTKVNCSTPSKSPWRTIQVAESPGDLITSYLILNLNEPNKMDDLSWIEPGKYVGIWWELHLAKTTWGQGPNHGATTSNTKKYIDFAAKHGFKGVLVEGWNQGWDGDWIKNGDQFSFTKPYNDFDIKEITDYALSKGVRLIGHNETGGAVLNYEAQVEDAFEFYNNHGVRAVKTGYVNHGPSIKRIDENGDVQLETHHGQFMVQHYQKVNDLAIQHQIMLNVHEPIKATGLRRTYPNMMTREGARGQEFNAWSPDGGNPPEHETILPFTRMLAGPMDFTPGIFDLTFEEAKPDNRVNTTLAKQLALYVVFYSPFQMAADLPENYEANLKPFKFIVDVPCDWADTRVLNAEIGEYITTVRKDRNSSDWYLGSITDEN